LSQRSIRQKLWLESKLFRQNGEWGTGALPAKISLDKQTTQLVFSNTTTSKGDVFKFFSSFRIITQILSRGLSFVF